ncbi:hypothetical protein Bbelb_421630 [Branchiostoma belcheri]|nr:hypothetical protein Bbelb_421630 [Branchiostoma belcheri]
MREEQFRLRAPKSIGKTGRSEKNQLGRALADIDSDSPLFVDALGDQDRSGVTYKSQTTRHEWFGFVWCQSYKKHLYPRTWLMVKLGISKLQLETPRPFR